MKVVPKDVLGAIQDGQIHTLTKGFGLGGGIGYGKSCAISALLKLGLARWAHASSSGWDFRPTSRRTPVISWVNWPNTADQLQQLATNGNAVHSLMYAIKGANILVIDDLGKERLPVIREDRSIPFCQAQLDIIIDFRNGHRLPT